MPAFCGKKSQDCNGRESWNRSSSHQFARAAKTIGLTIPPGILDIADEVIE
jgi:hypothetical protein